jgi:transposase
MVAWADPYQRQSRRLQHRLTVEAASMPVMHVASLYGLSWLTVRRAEQRALERWERTRPPVPLHDVGVDEKWLGRRNKLADKFVTVVSNLATGEPVWIGYGRKEDTLKRWLAQLTPEQKTGIRVFAMDMHRPFMNAVRDDPAFKRTPIVHDPFHVMKRATDAMTELRREIFFRAGPEMRTIGRGTRWLVLRPWERTTQTQRDQLRLLFSFNGRLARAYQVVEQLREALHAPNFLAMLAGISLVLRRTRRRDNVPMRKLHDSLLAHLPEIVALGEHHPFTGRIEALNNNWETLVRRARGYRDHDYLLRKLRFMVANPIRSNDGIKRFLALGLMPPLPRRQAA